jgi:ferritin-like metal-binding protein YciE
MPISDSDAVDYGFLVVFAEDLYVPGSVTPHDEPRIAAAGWDVVGHFLAFDSVLPNPSALPAGIPNTLRLGQTVFYGFLARNKADPSRYVAAIRGTSGFAEWAIDADFLPLPLPTPPGGTVENGFWSIYASMTLVGLDGKAIGTKAADGIAEAVGEATVTICGHSLGAAIASYLSFDVAKLVGNRASACLFASPRAGDLAWTTAYAAVVSTYRLTNYLLDVVPYAPFNAPPAFQYSTFDAAGRSYPAAVDGAGGRQVRHPLQSQPHLLLRDDRLRRHEEARERRGHRRLAVHPRTAGLRPQPRADARARNTGARARRRGGPYRRAHRRDGAGQGRTRLRLEAAALIRRFAPPSSPSGRRDSPPLPLAERAEARACGSPSSDASRRLLPQAGERMAARNYPPSPAVVVGRQTPREQAMPTRKSANPLEDLFTETLKDIYFAEKQILRALPKMAKEAKSPELKQAFEKHREETEDQVERLNQIFDSMGRPARGKTCEAIIGIIDEAKEFMDEFKGEDALDPALIASAQTVEHYEIARYGTLKSWARDLGMDDAVKLLDQTLEEEIKTDKTLTDLAVKNVNKKAA